MLCFFPTPYPDELFYSIIARYRKWTGEPSIHTMLQELFGVRHVTATFDMPSHLGFLANIMPLNSGITADRLVKKHTLYPLYTAFLPEDQTKAIYHSMVTGHSGGDIYTRTGLMASKIRYNRWFRYCPICAKEDLEEKYGEMYWYRTFQIPGLDICIKHEVWLQNSKVMLRQENKHQFVAPDEENCPLDSVTLVTDSKLMQQYRLLGNAIEHLLNETYPNRPFNWFEECYLSKLQTMGYASINGAWVDQERLKRDFIENFGMEWLERMQSTLDEENSWLAEITRKHRKSFHPIRHLLLMNFLGLSLEEVFYQEPSFQPFGSGPWQCLNPASDHYQKRVISNLTLTACDKTKKIVGTFSCDCGFVYTRRAGNDDDPTRISRVKQYGEVWEKECKRLADAGLNLREIGRRLKADPMTIKKYLQEEQRKQGINEQSQAAEQRAFDRMKWLQLQESHPELSKTELRKLDPALYARLYRNDRRWLEQKSPKGKSRASSSGRVDWDARDKELLEKVKDAVEQILNVVGKPKRITVGRIGAVIGMRALLEKHLDKMPKTKEYLEQVVESEDKHRLRKIEWAMRELEREGEDILKWKVLRKAGIRPENFDIVILNRFFGRVNDEG